MASFPPFPRVTRPLGRNLLDFVDETYNANSRGMGLSCGENFIVQTPTVFDWSTRVTDGQTGNSI